MALVAAAVVMVSCELTALPLGVTLEGEKTQVASEGNPEHAKVTAWLKPFFGVTVKVTNPDLPLLMLRLAALEATEKLGVGITASVTLTVIGTAIGLFTAPKETRFNWPL